MHTGDQGVIDEEGYCRIVGRLKDMVIRGGENIYPREVEEFLYGHPKVQDVQCFGVTDAHYGEALAAAVVLKEGETCEAEEIKAYCQGRIAHYKIPAHIRFVADFPKTVTGKVQKYLLRRELEEDLGLSDKDTA